MLLTSWLTTSFLVFIKCKFYFNLNSRLLRCVCIFILYWQMLSLFHFHVTLSFCLPLSASITTSSKTEQIWRTTIYVSMYQVSNISMSNNQMAIVPFIWDEFNFYSLCRIQQSDRRIERGGEIDNSKSMPLGFNSWCVPTFHVDLDILSSWVYILFLRFVFIFLM